MMRASWSVALLVLTATFVLPSAAAQSFQDCTGDPPGEGIYVSGCRAWAVGVAGGVVDLALWAVNEGPGVVVATALCFYNTAPSQWVQLVPGGIDGCVSVTWG